MDYDYDVFLSYHRRDPVRRWVENHFYPRLDEWLRESLGRDARIFFDRKSIDGGSHWPSELRRALLKSRILVPVLSPTYFSRAWCLAEWETMRSRQHQVGPDVQGLPRRLIYPVWFFDGDSFPEHAREIQYYDLRLWNKDFKAYEETKAYVDFLEAMQTIAWTLKALIAEVPPWDPTFPSLTPAPTPPPPMLPPRL